MLVEGKQQCPNRTGKVAIVTSGAIQFNYPPANTPSPPFDDGFLVLPFRKLFLGLPPSEISIYC